MPLTAELVAETSGLVRVHVNGRPTPFAIRKGLQAGDGSDNVGVHGSGSDYTGPYQGYDAKFVVDLSDYAGAYHVALINRAATLDKAVLIGVDDDGNITIDFGASTTQGLRMNGLLRLAELPTDDPHVVGYVWNNAGTLKVSAGP